MASSDLLKISFEFSPKLGIRELPQLDANHQSNISGLYVVGDLADAPIIKVALNQGYEVAEKVAKQLSSTHDPNILDVAIIGAGPAGIGAALALKEAGARFVVFEKGQPFQTIQNFPKAKHIFSEPREMIQKGNFWFEDASKEDLVSRWGKSLEERSLPIQQPVEVVGMEKKSGLFHIKLMSEEAGETLQKARFVILAIGRRAAVRKLNAPGEDLEKVAYTLRDPEDYRGKKLLVAGGGDSAVEAAISCAQAGAEVTICYRGHEFSRAKAENRQQIEAMIQQGQIQAIFESSPVEVHETSVILANHGEHTEIPNDQVLVFFGTKLPRAFLKKLGIRMAGEMDFFRAAWIASFALLTYLVYVLKTKNSFFPFGEGQVLGFVPELLKVDLGFRTVDASFWGTCLYGTLILIFGIKAWRKYPSPVQKRRYVSLIVAQWVFLFGIPELLAPFIIERPWKLYALTVPWPLSIWSLIDAPSWANGDRLTALLWIGAGCFSAFVVIPLIVRKHGQRFCSYFCGCGGLAETLGDLWRHLAPRGKTAYQAEWFGRAILILAIPVTLLILNDAWKFFASDALYNTKAFAQHWYGLMVDFWLASVIGVALYPYLGNRVWCRFFCPLRAYMEILSRKFSRIAIHANKKCIGCGECTRFCQMGIDVQSFAQRATSFDNGNSSCIHCGICVQVCPMDVLSLGEREKKPSEAGFMAPYYPGK